MAGYSWFNTANGGVLTPSITTSGGGFYEFPYSSWNAGMQLTMPFAITESGYELAGYYFWWDGTNSVLLYDMCLWQFTSGTWSAVANSDVTPSPLSAGWNYLELGSPISLQAGVLYAIVTNQTNGFYDNTGFFSDYASGSVNGPLTLYGPTTIPDGQTAGVFGEATAASAAALTTFPDNVYQNSGYPIDVLVQPVSTGGSPSITTTSLPGAISGTAYDETLAASGGTGPYTWSVTIGSLPANLHLSTTGILSGTPTTGGTSSFTAQVEDANSNTATATLSITVAAIGFRIGTTNMADSATSCTITVPGTVAVGDVVLITAQQVVISETSAILSASSTETQPLQLGQQQNAVQTVTPGVLNAAVFGFTAGASDAGAIITISSADSGYWALALAAYEGAKLPVDVISGTANNTEAAVTCPALTTTQNNDFAIYLGGGAVESGDISGIPSGSITREGITSDAAVAAIITDSDSSVASGTGIGGGQFTTPGSGGTGTPNLLSAFSIGLASIDDSGNSPSITTTSFANIAANVPILRFVSATGGTSPYTWSVSSGSLPTGLTLTTSGSLAGTLSGTVTVAEDYSFTLEVTDAASNTASASFSITVVNAPLDPTNSATDGNGVITWQVTSPINLDDSESIRVLRPTAPNNGYAHGFLFTLPVAGGTDDTSYGNGLDTIREQGLHNIYNLTVIEASTGGNWLADNPTDTNLIQESYIVQVTAWAKSTYGTGNEKNYLIGFSRSGIGGQGLFFHHPDIFQGVASWDFPAMMTTYDGTDVDGTTGGDPAGSYGTQDNFASNYELSPANLTRWFEGQDFGTVNRIWIGGYFAFQDDVNDYDPVLTTAGILHTFSLIQTSEHNWAPSPGWVTPTLAALLGAPQTNGLLLAIFP